MKVVKYKPEHVFDLALRPWEAYLHDTAEFEEWAKRNAEGRAWTGIVDGTVVACGGITDMWQGVGEGWVILSLEAAQLYPIAVYRAVKRKLKECLNFYHRIQAHSRVDFPLAYPFALSLGFEVEGYMKGYYPDKCDAILYALTR